MDSSTTDTLPRVGAPQPTPKLLEERYEVFDHVGDGPLGPVDRAWDHQLQQAVAIKWLDPRLAAVPAVAGSFETAARRASSLPPHRHIVRVDHVGRHGSSPYVVRQFFPGQNLKDLLAREGPLPLERALDLCEQAAQGLAFAHQYGLVHGNLKPQNILVSGLEQVKLSDFGAAHADEGDASCASLVQAQYRAPEVASAQPPTPASDVYALGVVLFEMLTGRLPFEAESATALAAKQARAAPPDPRQLNPTLPPAVSALVRRALAPNPSNRYRSAAAMAAAMHQLLGEQKGHTAPLLHQPDAGQGPERGRPAPPPPRQDTRAIPVIRRSSSTPWLTLTSLVFVLVVLVAAAGGWVTYRALRHALNPGAPTAGALHGSRVSYSGAHRPGPAPSHAAAATHSGPGPGAGCPAAGPGSIRFLRMWAEEVQVPAGGSVTFDYFLANDTSRCRRVRLELTAFSDVQAGLSVRDPADSKVVSARPGLHRYQRTFTFPPSAAGQRFDVVLRVADPSGAQGLGAIRVNHLLDVRSP